MVVILQYINVSKSTHLKLIQYISITFQFKRRKRKHTHIQRILPRDAIPQVWSTGLRLVVKQPVLVPKGTTLRGCGSDSFFKAFHF